MIVVDASVILDLLLGGGEEAALGRRLAAAGSLHAPHLLDLEAAQVLRRHCRSGALAAERAEQALEALSDLAIVRHPHLPLLGRVWALRGALTAFDAAYVALAEALRAPLVTRDAKLARTVSTSVEVALW